MDGFVCWSSFGGGFLPPKQVFSAMGWRIDKSRLFFFQSKPGTSLVDILSSGVRYGLQTALDEEVRMALVSATRKQLQTLIEQTSFVLCPGSAKIGGGIKIPIWEVVISGSHQLRQETF